MKWGLGIILLALLCASLARAETVATPTCRIVHFWTSREELNVACPTPGAVVYYTTNGKDPTENDSIAVPEPYYTANVIIDRKCTLKVRAFKPGMEPSAILSLTFPIMRMDIPVIVPASGQYSEAQKVVVHSTIGSTIYYTLDGTQPGLSCDSIPSGSTVLVDHPATLKVIACKQDCSSSLVTTASYTFREPVILHVRTDGNNADNGLTWESAKLTIQGAVDAAVGGDEIWVAEGTYAGAYLKHGIRLYGGFIGTETSLGQRDYVHNRTIVDGGTWGLPMLQIMNATSATVIDGFVIEHSLDYGAISCSFASPTIVNNIIINSRDHAGILMQGYPDRFLIANNVIVGGKFTTGINLRNWGQTRGPISTDESAGLITNNCLIANSTSGIYAYHVKVTAANNIIAFNDQGISQSDGHITLRNNCLFGNKSADYLDNHQEVVPHPTDINVDPMFVDAANGDYRLRWDSPCVDAGTNDGAPETDILGTPRPIDGDWDGTATADIGAYEYTPRLVNIDVLPWNSLNTFRLMPAYMIGAAFLGDSDLDVRDINPLSVTFGPKSALPVNRLGQLWNVNFDRFTDWLFYFPCGQTGIGPGTSDVVLRARLRDGEPIEGTDSVTATK